ncbi:MAG: Nif3-like dinuclear metal center hexameric protein [Anaerolineae bacterium]|nr:Nif3-like dinuclear metal center hexameric protein [Anaerolineae bacterium]
MHLNQITKELDAFFRIGEFEPDLPFSRLVPQVYGKAGIAFSSFLEQGFLETFHGLMMRNSQNVDQIRCTVFLSEEIVDKVLAQNERNVLLISHHPLVMETSDRGFLPLSEEHLQGMREQSVSVYVLHTPLDVHGEVSTSRALTRELGVRNPTGYYQGPSGPAASYGHLPDPIALDDFLKRVAQVTGVNDLHFIKNRETVHSVGIIAGGTDARGILETAALGCDTLLTGTYYNQVQTEIGQWYRDEFAKIRDGLEINLVEASHYATEAIVMQMDIVDFCADRFKIDCEFIPQDDPWY